MRRGWLRMRKFRTAVLIPALGLAVSASVALGHTPVTRPGPAGVLGTSTYDFRPPNLFTHDAGPLMLQITNMGMIGNPFYGDFSAGWQGDEYLYYAGLWVGAVGPDHLLHVSTAGETEFRPVADPRWKIRESFEGADHANRLNAGEFSGDDDGDGLADEDFQDGLDNDGDGLIDEDYAAIGSQMFSCAYRDDTPEAIANLPGHVPLGLLVHQRSFQWSLPGIDEFVAVDYQIINDGDATLNGPAVGIFCDPDIGPKDHDHYWMDDLIGWDQIDTTMTVSGVSGVDSRLRANFTTVFMWDAPDAYATTPEGDAPGVFGTVIFWKSSGEYLPVRESSYPLAIRWFHPDSPDSLPFDDGERLGAMWNRSRPGGNPRPGVAAANASVPSDYSYLMSMSTYEGMFPGESRSFQVAFVIGDGFTGFRQNAARAVMVHERGWVDADHDPETGVDGKETCLKVLQQGDVLNWDDPCDTLHTTRTIKSLSCVWVDADCNPATGVLGRETPVRWTGVVPPPNPRTNLDPALSPGTDSTQTAYVPPAGDGRVTLEWDNRSECYDMNDLAGGRTFEGYRVWRVSHWQGQWVGPGDRQWALVAEFRTHPTDDAVDLASITDPDLAPVRHTQRGCPIYPVGRYTWVDTLAVNGQRYRYAVTAFGMTADGEEGNDPYSPPAWAVVPCAGCSPKPAVLPTAARPPARFAAGTPYPNPFGRRTSLEFALPETRPVRVTVYDLQGRLVRTLMDGQQQPGSHTVTWRGRTDTGGRAAAGWYLIKLRAGAQVQVRRVVLLD